MMIRTIAALLLLASVAAADEVELVDGTKIEGKVTDLGDSIKITKGGASITYPKSAVKKITYRKTAEELYAEKTKELKDDDLDGRVALAKWCLENKLSREAKAEWQKVVAIDPDHEEARSALGFAKYNGKWMTDDEIKTAQGLVKHKGKWMTPEERDLELALEEQKETDKKLLAEVKKWLDKVGSTKEEVRTEAKEKLAAIGDAYKKKAYLAGISSTNEHIRLHVTEELGRMGEKAASKPLARRLVWDAKEEIRAAALKALLAIGDPDTSLHLIPYLDEYQILARIRTEDALSYFKDLRAAMPLLVVLANAIDTLKFIEKYEGQMQQMVRRTMILKTGQKVIIPDNLNLTAEMFDAETKARLRTEKDSCATALRAITGQDFGEDVAKWAAWLKKKK